MLIQQKLPLFFKKSSYTRGLRLLKNEGFFTFAKRAAKILSSADTDYEQWLELHSLSQSQIEYQQNKVFDYKPLISIVVPVFKTPKELLQQMINSVLEQTYSNWQLCISDGSGKNSPIKDILKEYTNKNNKIKCVFSESQLQISENSNEAIKITDGDYVALLDHDDILTKDALFEVVDSLQDTKHDLIYSDEDFVSENLDRYFAPFFKPDWSPEYLCTHNYITHLMVVKKSLLDQVGYFNSKYDGAQDFDLTFRITESANSIHHIPKILYHWRVCKNSVASDSKNKLYAYEAGKLAIEDHLQRIGVTGQVEMIKDYLGYYHVIYDTPGDPCVSIIIPNKDHVSDLKKCLDSLYEVNNYKNFKIIIVENNSENDKTFEFYKSLEKKHDNIKIVTYKGDFNYSAINNFAFKYVDSPYTLFLNNDTQMIEPNSIREMLGVCMKPEVGIVGAKLLFDDDTIQHAGVVMGFGNCAGHVFSGLDNGTKGYKMLPLISCNFSAVTAACMLTKSEIFKALNGFDETFKVAFNDVDYCLRVREVGKYVVYNAWSEWYHFESKSRGYETTKEKKERFNSEKKHLREKWDKYFPNNDPFYNPNFSIDYYTYSIYPYKRSQIIKLDKNGHIDLSKHLYQYKNNVLHLDNIIYDKNNNSFIFYGWCAYNKDDEFNFSNCNAEYEKSSKIHLENSICYDYKFTIKLDSYYRKYYLINIGGNFRLVFPLDVILKICKKI